MTCYYRHQDWKCEWFTCW